MTAFISALAIAPAIVSAQGKAVVMLAKDGTSYELPLDKVSRIDFNPSEVALHGRGGEVKTMPYADINRILIGADPAGLTELFEKGEIAVWPSPTTGPLSIAGAEVGTLVRVYDQKGVLVASAKVGDDTLVLDISNASPGLAVVQIGNMSVKIMKK